jgi:hypothetical protein
VTDQPPIERLVARVLRLGLPPTLHPGALVPAVLDEVMRAARHGEAPNRITIRLHPTDAQALRPVLRELEAALTTALAEAAGRAGLRPFGPWLLTFLPTASAESGSPRIRADFHDPDAPASISTTRQTVHLRRIQGLRLRVDDGRVVPLTHAPFTLGRSSDCDLVLPNLAVSRRHAELRYGPGGEIELRDLGSRNGTFIHGEPITAAPIVVGDRFRLGPVELALEATP